MTGISEKISIQIKRYNLENNLFWPVLCFFLMCCNEGVSTRFMAMALLVWSFFRLLLGTGKWVEKLPLPFFFLSMYMLWNGVRSFSAISTEFAFQDYTKLLVAFLLLFLMLEREKKPKHIAQIILVTSTISSFLSMDLLGTHWFTGLFQVFMSPFTAQYTILVGIEEGVRMVSIYSNPNIYAGFTGIAILFGLALVVHCHHRKKRIFLLLCLFCNSLGFLLAFSLGATITLALTFLLYFLLESREKKLPLLILMIETFFSALLSAFPVYLTSFSKWDGVNFYPLLSLVVGGLLFCFVHENLGKSLQIRLAHRDYIPLKYILAFVGSACLFVLIGLNWTNPAQLEQGASLRRAVYLGQGDYELSLQSTGLMEVSIHAQDKTDILRHTSSLLYQGQGNLVEFQVPEDTVVVFFTFSSAHAVVIEECFLSDGSEIPLNYVLFPEFVSHRLQGLLSNQNFWQRFVFFHDGLKLFAMNPMFGLGMGAFNSGLFRVQSFYYETKYAHNHYIQVLLESGVLGFVLFFGAMLSLILSLWKERDYYGGHFVPVSLSVLLFTLCHGFMELTWSSGSFLVLAFLTLALCFLQSTSLWERTEKIQGFVIPGLMVFSSFWFSLISCQLTGEIILNCSTDTESFQENLHSAVRLDILGRSGHMTSYVHSVGDSDDPTKIAQAEDYIQKIKAENSNVAAFYIAEYYFKQENYEKAMYYLEVYVKNGASHPEIWNSAFDLLHLYGWYIEEDFFIEANRHIYQIALDWDEENMGAPVIAPDIREYVVHLLEEEA